MENPKFKIGDTVYVKPPETEAFYAQIIREPIYAGGNIGFVYHLQELSFDGNYRLATEHIIERSDPEVDKIYNKLREEVRSKT